MAGFMTIPVTAILPFRDTTAFVRSFVSEITRVTGCAGAVCRGIGINDRGILNVTLITRWSLSVVAWVITGAGVIVPQR